MNKLVLRWAFVATLLIQSFLVCGVARAQTQLNSFSDVAERGVAVVPSPTVMAAQFPATDDSLTARTSVGLNSLPWSFVADPGDFAAHSPVVAMRAVPTPAPAANPALPSPKPKPRPRPYYGEDPNKWQLGIAFALVRFRSSVYFASAPGLNSSLAYWFREWIAIEGSVTSAFAPPVFENEHFRYLSYGAGPKFSLGHGRLEPWAHALVGGVHLIPQTASGGQNGAEFTIGGGVDYALNNVLSAKGAVDYLGTHMFGEWQSSVQILAGFSFRF